MPKCKLDQCNNEALPTGKRYCQQHKDEYLQKQKEYRERGEAAPKCINCREAPVFNGHLICNGCEAELTRMEEQNIKYQKWNDISDIESLKDWLVEYTNITQ